MSGTRTTIWVSPYEAAPDEGAMLYYIRGNKLILDGNYRDEAHNFLSERFLQFPTELEISNREACDRATSEGYAKHEGPSRLQLLKNGDLQDIQYGQVIAKASSWGNVVSRSPLSPHMSSSGGGTSSYGGSSGGGHSLRHDDAAGFSSGASSYGFGSSGSGNPYAGGGSSDRQEARSNFWGVLGRLAVVAIGITAVVVAPLSLLGVGVFATMAAGALLGVQIASCVVGGAFLATTAVVVTAACCQSNDADDYDGGPAHLRRSSNSGPMSVVGGRSGGHSHAAAAAAAAAAAEGDDHDADYDYNRRDNRRGVSASAAADHAGGGFRAIR